MIRDSSHTSHQAEQNFRKMSPEITRLADSSPGTLPGEWLFLLKVHEALVHRVVKRLTGSKQRVSIYAPNIPKQPCAQMVQTSFRAWAAAKIDTQSRASNQGPGGVTRSSMFAPEKDQPHRVRWVPQLFHPLIHTKRRLKI